MYSKKRTNYQFDDSDIYNNNNKNDYDEDISENNNNNLYNQKSKNTSTNKYKKHKANGTNSPASSLIHQHLPAFIHQKKNNGQNSNKKKKSSSKIYLKIEKGKIQNVSNDIPYYEEEDSKFRNIEDHLGVEDSFDHDDNDSSSTISSDSDSSSIQNLEINNVINNINSNIKYDNETLIIHPESPMFPWVSIIHCDYIELTSRLIFNDLTCDISKIGDGNDLLIEYLVQYPKIFCDMISIPTESFKKTLKMIIKHPGSNYEDDIDVKFENSNISIFIKKIKDDYFD